MPKKQKIIFIIAFLVVGVILLGFYSWYKQRNNTDQKERDPWYQSFNPFGGGLNLNKEVGTEGGDLTNKEGSRNISVVSRFSKLTDFAVSGAMFTEETRLIKDSNIQTEKEVPLDPKTKEGRIKIQSILNKKLFANPPLIEDGNFGTRTISLIKEFQKANSLPETGLIDQETSPYFTEIKTTASQEKYETIPTLRYVERMNGHIHNLLLNTNKTEKISNSTIPSIYEAFFDKEGKTVIYRYLSANNIVSSFLATLGNAKGEYLPSNITELSTSQDKSKFFYITENTGGATGTVVTFGNSSKTIVFNSPFTEWISDWDASQNIYLTTKASYAATGSIFELNSQNKTLSKLFGGIIGLTTKINKAGNVVLYSSSENSTPKLSVFKKKDYSFKNLDTYGFPEKCAWSYDNITVYCAVPSVIEEGNYPDIWYQGLVSFDDYFLKINTETGEKITYANSKNEIPVDAVSLFLDKKEETLFFINKKDYTLWSLNLK